MGCVFHMHEPVKSATEIKVGVAGGEGAAQRIRISPCVRGCSEHNTHRSPSRDDLSHITLLPRSSCFTIVPRLSASTRVHYPIRFPLMESVHQSHMDSRAR